MGAVNLRLIDLVKGAESEVRGDAAIEQTEITGLSCDSRRIAPGFLFAAIPGTGADGRAFIPDAIGRGAVAVLAPPGTEERTPVPLIIDPNPRRRYALMSARFHSEQPDTIAAITGTNGKTSVASFVRQIWERSGEKAASLGTLGVTAPGLNRTEGLTTPDPADLHETLKDLAGLGVECLAMEASSHGLAQHRLDGVRIRLAAFTNLSRDHLDYHGTMEDYLKAKMRLFEELLATGGCAVLNADEASCDAIENVLRGRDCRVLTYGLNGRDLRLKEIHPTAEGQKILFEVLGSPYEVMLPLPGAFQVENALAALGLAIGSGVDPEEAVWALSHLEGVPGRMQHAGTTKKGASVYVDYAHTPDALANVLKSLRPHVKNRLHVVFGCGGDRDRGKRPEMGAIACELADAVIVTDDNPRTEDAAAIRKQILESCPDGMEVGNRAQAIEQSVHALNAGDVLVVAGKGHETGQIVAGVVHPFDDAEEIRKSIGNVST